MNLMKAKCVMSESRSVNLVKGSLSREVRTVPIMPRALELGLKIKKRDDHVLPPPAANGVSSTEEATLEKQALENVKEIATINGTNSFPTLPS